MRVSLDIPFQIKALINALDSSLIRATVPDARITHVSTDTRNMSKGDLFIAIRGEKHDANNYVSEAIAKGCITLGEEGSGAHITVNDSNQGLLDSVNFYKSLFKNLKASIAITGSVGKSTTKSFLYKILSYGSPTHASFGNYNNLVGLAHTIFTMPENTEYLIAEMGMNHSGEISPMSKCLCPDLAIITCIGTAHIGHLGTREAIARMRWVRLYAKRWRRQ